MDVGHTTRTVFENLSLPERRYLESKLKTDGVRIKHQPVRLIHGSGNDTYEDSAPSTRRFARRHAWAAICTGSQGLESGGM